MGVLLLAGTTASGKSRLAIEIAERHDAVIVSADAMTIYRELDIGTAKPSAMEQARVPHLGIDLRDIHESFDVSDFCELVEQAMQEHPRVVIAGGTTFWLSSLINPLAPLPPPSPETRAMLEAIEDPHRALAAIDPTAAARLHPNDRVRVIRALEVFHLTGNTQTSIHARGPRTPPLEAEIVWLDRDDLKERIDQRLQGMQADGYLEEAEAALAKYPTGAPKPLKSFAYRHLIDHIRGDIDLDEALRRTGRDTWQYARKQRTWARGLGWSRTDIEAANERAICAFQATP